MLALARSPGTLVADQFSGRILPGDGKSPGIDRNQESERERRETERGPGTLAPDPLAPSRRFPAFGKTHSIPVASRSCGRLGFFYDHRRWFQHPGIPHKISSPPRSTSQEPPSLPPTDVPLSHSFTEATLSS